MLERTKMGVEQTSLFLRQCLSFMFDDYKHDNNIKRNDNHNENNKKNIRLNPISYYLFHLS